MKKTFATLLTVIFGIFHLFAFENYPAGARALSLSNAFVSISDTWCTFHNPAGIAGFENITAGIFFESRFQIDELSLSAGSFVLPANSGTFGLSFYQFGKGTFKENKIGLAFAKFLTEKITAAIQFNYYSQHFPENEKRKGFVTFESGIIYSISKNFVLGAHVFNPIYAGFETPEGKLTAPVILRFGGHFQPDKMILLTAEIEKDNHFPLRLKSGIEFSPAEHFYLRFGASGKPVNFTSGVGYCFRKITTDIAFLYHEKLGITPAVSIQIQL